MEKISCENENKYEFLPRLNSKIYDVRGYDLYGPPQFSFDKKIVYDYIEDYPHNLTIEQKKLFDKAFPFWAKHYIKCLNHRDED